MVMWESDHNLLIINVQEKRNGVNYEDMWIAYEGCKIIVREMWGSFEGKKNINLVQIFKNCSKASTAKLLW